jgi:hypothetical protein
MKSGFRSRLFNFSFEIPTAVYAVVGLTAVAFLAVQKFGHLPQKVDAQISPHGIHLAVDPITPAHAGPVQSTLPPQPENSAKVRWVLRGTPLMDPPLSLAASGLEKQTDFHIAQNKPSTSSEYLPRGAGPKAKKDDAVDTKPTRWAYGYYYVQVMAQGDAYEGEFELQKRPCHPLMNMPYACYYPQKERFKFPIREN